MCVPLVLAFLQKGILCPTVSTWWIHRYYDPFQIPLPPWSFLLFLHQSPPSSLYHWTLWRDCAMHSANWKGRIWRWSICSELYTFVSCTASLEFFLSDFRAAFYDSWLTRLFLEVEFTYYNKIHHFKVHNYYKILSPNFLLERIIYILIFQFLVQYMTFNKMAMDVSRIKKISVYYMLYAGISQIQCAYKSLSSVQLSSVAQSCPTLCDPMSYSTPGLLVHHQLPESMSIKSVMLSNHLILCHPLLLLTSIFPSVRVFSNE